VKFAQADAAFGKGVQLMQQQLFAEAAAEFEHALAADPSLGPARYQYAVCLFSMGKNDEARKQFEMVSKETADSSETAYYLGRLDLLAGDYPGAIRRLTPLAEKIPQAAFYLGEAFVSAGDAAAGLKWLERAAQAAPRDYRVHYRLGRAYAAAGRSSDAEREYGIYNQLRGEHKGTETQARACNEALSKQSAADARETCRRMFDPNDPEKLVLMAQLLGEHGAFDEAIDPLERAVKLDPGSFDAWHDLGLTYFRMKRYADARQPLEKAVALRPDFFETLNLLGATLYMLGDDRAALPVIERAHRLHPDDAELERVLRQLQQAQGAKQ
jgi:tetratricopeptide (TPR) repeat protein